MRRGLFVALVLLAACSRSPSSPSSPASAPPAPIALADFSGYWSGTFAYRGCPIRHCDNTSQTDPFSLRLRQSANHVMGLFETRGSSIEISGDVQPDGSLRLSGTEATGGTYGVPGDATFTAPSLRLDPALGLSGGMRYERRTILGPLDRPTVVKDGQIVSAVHSSLDAFVRDLSGSWTGLYLVTQCADESGRALCYPFLPGQVEFLTVTLAVSGSSASGEVVSISTRVPVQGSAHGRIIDLEGSREDPSVRVTDRITSFSGTADDFGRLKGRFSFRRSFNGATSSAELELVQVVKVR